MAIGRNNKHFLNFPYFKPVMMIRVSYHHASILSNLKNKNMEAQGDIFYVNQEPYTKFCEPSPHISPLICFHLCFNMLVSFVKFLEKANQILNQLYFPVSKTSSLSLLFMVLGSPNPNLLEKTSLNFHLCIQPYGNQQRMIAKLFSNNYRLLQLNIIFLGSIRRIFQILLFILCSCDGLHLNLSTRDFLNSMIVI